MHTLFSQSERSHTNLDAYDGDGEGMGWKPLQAHVLGKITWENFPEGGLDSQEAELARKYLSSGGT